MAAGTANKVDTSVAATPRRRLFHNGLMKSGSRRTFSNHLRENPLGGNMMKSPAVKPATITTMIGARRNSESRAT